jgi:hypothetical protein
VFFAIKVAAIALCLPSIVLFKLPDICLSNPLIPCREGIESFVLGEVVSIHRWSSFRAKSSPLEGLE